MIVNDSGTDLYNADVCIVGAGPAGITLASELSEGGFNVLLLESGDFNHEITYSNLNDGSINLKYEKNVIKYDRLKYDRIRRFGGTSAIWGGMVAPLDPEDFMVRDWVPNSGWPIKINDLYDYYNKASNLLGIPHFFKNSQDALNLKIAKSDDHLNYKNFFYTKKLSFYEAFKKKFINSQKITVVPNATAVKLFRNNFSAQIDEILVVNTLTSKPFSVKANKVILCCGAIENTRLLLASHDSCINLPALGCYFQGHGHGLGLGRLYFQEDSLTEFKYFNVDDAVNFRLARISNDLQKKRSLLNCYASLIARSDDLGVSSTPDFIKNNKYEFSSPNKFSTYSSEILFEQESNINNRIYLTNKIDRLGMRNVEIDYRFSDLEFKTIKQVYIEIARFFGINLLGKVWLEERLEKIYNSLDPSLAKHHIGTTRMGVNSDASVVDSNLKVHHLSNLYICSSSVFPTGGAVNPTFTILSLAYRLADYLKK